MNAREESKIEAGEVETPCATCGGSGTDAAGISDAPCDICGGSGIAPDCRVETPEAISDDALIEAVKAISEVLISDFPTVDAGSAVRTLIAQGWKPRSVETPEAARAKAIEVMRRALLYSGELAHDVRSNMAVALDALIAQGWTPPGGTE